MNATSAGKAIELLQSLAKPRQTKKRAGSWYKPCTLAELNGVPGFALKIGKSITFCTPTKIVELKGSPSLRRASVAPHEVSFKILSGFAEGVLGKEGKAGASGRKVIAHAVNRLAMQMCCSFDEKHRAMAHLLNVCAWAISADDYLEAYAVSGKASLADEMRLRYATERHERRVALALEIIDASDAVLPELAAALRLAVTNLGDRQLVRDAAKLLAVISEPTVTEELTTLVVDASLPDDLIAELICNDTLLIIPGSGEYTLITPEGKGITLSSHDEGHIDMGSSTLVPLMPYRKLTVDEHLRELAGFMASSGGRNHELLMSLVLPGEEGVTPEFRGQVACLMLLGGREHTRDNGANSSIAQEVIGVLRREVWKSQIWRVDGCIEWQQARDGVGPMQFVMDELGIPSSVDLIFGALASASIGSSKAKAALEAFKREGIEDVAALPATPIKADPAEALYAPGSPYYTPASMMVNAIFADVAARNHALVHEFLCKMPDFRLGLSVEDGNECFAPNQLGNDYCAKLNGELHMSSVVPLQHKPGACVLQVQLVRKDDGNYRMIFTEQHLGGISHRDDASYTSFSVLFGGLIKKRLITVCGSPLDRAIDVSTQAQLDRLKSMIEDPERTTAILVSGIRSSAKAFVEQGSEGILVVVLDSKLDAREIGLSWVKAERKWPIYPGGRTTPVYANTYSQMMWVRHMGVERIHGILNKIEPLAVKIQKFRMAQAASAASREARLIAEVETARAENCPDRSSIVDVEGFAPKAELERLSDEKMAAELEVQHLRAEVNQLRRELREEQLRREGVVANFAGVDVGEEALRAFDTETFEELPEWSKTIAGRVTVTTRAIKEAQGITGYMNCPQVYGVLQAMHDHLWPSKFAGDTGGMGRWLEFLKDQGLDFAKCGEVARSHSLGSSYQVMHAGERLELDMHIRGHSGRDIRRQLRIYYTWHEKTRQLVIGSMPSHLPIASS